MTPARVFSPLFDTCYDPVYSLFLLFVPLDRFFNLNIKISKALFETVAIHCPT
jgi:hypothetical protein